MSDQHTDPDNLDHADHSNEDARSFQRLIARAKHGDDQALSDLWNQCRGYLLSIANRDLQPPELQKFGASDVVQQSMLIANEKLPQFSGSTQGQFFAWMKQVVLNECRTRRKSLRTRKREVNRERSTTAGSKEVPGFRQITDPYLTPGTRAVSDEQTQLIRVAMSRLDTIDQTVIRLRNWEDQSFESIGKQIGKSAEASRKVWARAIVKLERALKEMNAI
ncbi:RNA polymerase sigma factor [Mariniblastus fucicola]|uniref:RNA polymerase sigma factor RpoE n=1 Tax=Mariniblastus fucicola TaxID=980251 RepID=A0A5B9PKE9_9BACT|nr:sigma-70 family RNA polymerase sigma factor [Mariniblastus fucicola]QEG25202.1 RNA polymerase sigma factor RpoE [Mariniblastus fucicola]